ncbi:MAG: DNA-binding protein [Clostridia bacterium]|nr:DNA-binding protein [Clostridia bacterium]
MLKHSFLRVDDVAEILCISKSHAYKIVQKLNAEMKKQGFITIAGRVNKQFFLEKTCYGAAKEKEEN